ncbi:hypothetical protein C2G38_2046854 [Gigaspora rosea]|uniref:BTB domain-containing protein n=1 Tax=Gigaspora rosea TaxID=44941 RepID=A0A397U9G8_9GLOM|nr:hypothetical protein C2G38_2046854 [Gigaspora rosea]
MEEIYQFVSSEFLKKDEGKTTKPELKNLYFLNGDDPFNPDCWLLGNKLAFGIQDDIGSDLFKVNRRLEPFKNLLLAAGTKNMNHDIKIPKISINHSQQKNKLIEYLIERLKEEEPDPQFHDVIFEIGNLKIGANRCVLSYVAKDFDWDFSANPIIINNTQPNTYKVLLRWLYGMPYSEAVEEVFGENFSGQEYLDFLHDFLKASYKYPTLNDIIQNEIMDENKHLVNESNVKMVKDLSEECEADHLKKYCEEYIEKNQDIVDTVQKNKAQNIS